MSQHRFTVKHADHSIFVMAGWDRPLKQLFLLVEKEPNAAEGSEEVAPTVVLFDNGLRGMKDVAAIGSQLASLGISVPEKLLAEVELDRLNNVGNRMVVYEVPGAEAQPASPS